MPDLMRDLIDLCDLDREAHALKEQLALYPGMLADLEMRQSAASKQLEDAKARHAHAREERRKAELDVKALREQVDKFQLQQNQVKTNREYETVKEEIAATDRRIDAKDSEGLGALEAEEAAEEEIKNAKAESEETRKIATTERDRINARIEEKKDRLAQYQEDHVRRVAALPEEFQETYELLNERYPGSALAEAVDGSCGGCSINLVKQVEIDARKADGTVHCDNCSRILYDLSSKAVGSESV